MAVKSSTTRLHIECGTSKLVMEIPYSTLVSIHMTLARINKNLDDLAQIMCKKIDEAIQEVLKGEEKAGS